MQSPLFTQESVVPENVDEADTLNHESVRECSSGVEHRLHTAGVRGSKPRTRTIAPLRQQTPGYGWQWCNFEPLNARDHDPCSLYVVRLGPYHKIGISSYPERRLEALRTAVPFRISMVFTTTLLSFYARRFEMFVHDELTPYHHQGEWFTADLPTIKKTVNRTRKFVRGWISERRASLADGYWTIPFHNKRPMMSPEEAIRNRAIRAERSARRRAAQ